jgi:hypothetical protein
VLRLVRPPRVVTAAPRLRVALHSEKSGLASGPCDTPALPRPGPGYYWPSHCHRVAAVGKSSSVQWQCWALAAVAACGSSSGMSPSKRCLLPRALSLSLVTQSPAE